MLVRTTRNIPLPRRHIYLAATICQFGSGRHPALFSTVTASSGPAYGARFRTEEIKEMGVPFRFSIKRGNSEFFIVHLPVTVPSDCRLVKRPDAGTPQLAFGCPVGVVYSCRARLQLAEGVNLHEQP